MAFSPRSRSPQGHSQYRLGAASYYIHKIEALLEEY